MNYSTSELNEINITETKILSGEFGVYIQAVVNLLYSDRVSEEDKDTLCASFLIAIEKTKTIKAIMA